MSKIKTETLIKIATHLGCLTIGLYAGAFMVMHSFNLLNGGM